MAGFKTQFSQFPRFAQQGGATSTPQQEVPVGPMPTGQVPPPPPPPQVPPPMQPFIPPRRRSPMKVILIVFAVIILLSAVGVVSVLAMRVWDPLWSPFRPKPEVVLSQTISKMNNLKKFSYQTTGSISFDATDQNDKNINGEVSLNSKGQMDITDFLNLKLGSISDIVLDISSSDSNEDMRITASGETKVIDKKGYFKIGAFEATGSAAGDLSEYISSLNSIKDVWVKTALDQMGQNKSVENKVKTVFNKYPMWGVSSQLEDEKVGDVMVYHYVISLKKDNLKKAISEVIKISVDASDKTSQIGSAIDYYSAAADGVVSTFLDKIGDVNADIWVGKNDLLVYAVDFKKDLDLKNVFGSLAGSFSIKFNLKLTDHNKAVQVQIPSEAKDFNEVFGPVMERAEKNTKNNAIQTDLDQIKASAESLFTEKSSYSGLSCKSEDLVSVCADIKDKAGEEPKVFGYYKKYCAYSKLLKLNESDIQEYYCVDHNSSESCDGAECPTPVKTDINPGLKGYCTGSTFECPKPSPTPLPE